MVTIHVHTNTPVAPQWNHKVQHVTSPVTIIVTLAQHVTSPVTIYYSYRLVTYAQSTYVL